MMCQKSKANPLVFKASIGGIKTRLLIDNGSETELIDESFARTNKLSTFKLEKATKLTLGNGKVVQTLTTLRGCLVDVEIGDHKEQILCYLCQIRRVYSHPWRRLATNTTLSSIGRNVP